MRIYEELFIVKPDAAEEDVNAYLEQVRELIASGGGTVDKMDNWGVRRLAYRVSKYLEGRYVLVQFSSGPAVVKELERRMRVTDLVIKFITVRIDEKLKKIEKRKKQREKRAKRRPAPALTPAAVPAVPGVPGAAPGAAPGPPPAPAPPAPPAPAPATPEAFITQAAEAADKVEQ